MVLDGYSEILNLPWRETNIDSHPVISDDEIYSDLIQVASLYGFDEHPSFEYHSQVLNALSELSEIEAPLINHFGEEYSRSIFNNFKEEEADEVGLEYYVRAGYDPAQFEDSLLAVMVNRIEEISSLEEARAYCEQQHLEGKIVRSDDSHPSICWRVYNVRRELEIHAEYYSQFQQKPGETLSSSPTFEEFKASAKTK